MKKSVVVKGQKVQVEYKVNGYKEIANRDIDNIYINVFDRDYNFSFSINGKSYTVFHNHRELNGNRTLKWFVENQWVTSEKKMIEAILNK